MTFPLPAVLFTRNLNESFLFYCVPGGYVMGLLLNTICASQTLQLVCLCHHGSAMWCVGVVKVCWNVGVIWWKCGESLVKVWGWFGESLAKVWWKFGVDVVKVWWKCGESLVKWAVPFAKVLLSLESSNSLFVTLFVHCITCPELHWSCCGEIHIQCKL